MDKSVYNMKAEKIQRLVKQGDYETAAKICNTIDWSVVRSVRMLSLVSSIYEHVQQYDTAIDILLMAYEEAPSGRRYLYKLTELSLASGRMRDAENYYRAYLQEAADDNSRYILRYKIAEAKGESLDKRITILEAYKRNEFDEEWSYRLALLYAKARQAKKCVSLCDEIILWFGAGPYVDKAYELKSKFVPPTDPVDSYLVRREPRPEPVKKAPEPEPEPVKKPEPELELSAEDENERAIEQILPHNSYADEKEQADADEKRADELPKIELEGAKGEPYVKFADEDAFFPEEVEESSPSQIQDDVKIYHPVRKLDVNPQDGNLGQPATQRISIEDIRSQMFKNEEPSRGQKEEAGRQYDQMELDFNSEPARKVGHILFAFGDSVEEGLKAAVEQLAAAHRLERTPLEKVTRISAIKLNEKGLVKSLPGIEGKDLIILGAGSLNNGLLAELLKVSGEVDAKKFFVLADSRTAIEGIRARMETPFDAKRHAQAQEESAGQEAAAKEVEMHREQETAPQDDAPAPEFEIPVPHLELPEGAKAAFTGNEGLEHIPAYSETMHAPLPKMPQEPADNLEVEVTAPLDEVNTLGDPEEEDVAAFEKTVDELAVNPAPDTKKGGISEHEAGNAIAENAILYGEQLSLPDTDMLPQIESIPVGFDSPSYDAEDGDNPFISEQADSGKEVTLQALTSHGLENLKEEFPDADLELDDIFQQGE